MVNVNEHTVYSKYYRFNENALACLITNKIWMAHPNSFNDPFDSRVELPPDFIKEIRDEVSAHIERCLPGHENQSRRTLIRKGLQKYTDPLDIRRLLTTNSIVLDKDLSRSVQLMYLIADVYSTIGICSFARPKANPDQRLMWSHYGDSHKGFCIGYRFSKAKIVEQKLNASDVEGRGSPVQFPKDEFRKQSDRQQVMAWVMDRIRIKDMIWGYEQEFRLSGACSNQLVPLPGEVVEITLGLKMKASHQETLISLAKSMPHLNKAKIRVVRENYDSFEHAETDHDGAGDV